MRISKPEIRKDVKLRIQSMHDRAVSDNAICSRILCSSEFKNADYVLGYAAMNDEADISAVLDEAIKQGKKVCMPRINGSHMHFRVLSKASELYPGAFNIMEPSEDAPIFNMQLKQAYRVLVLVPGRAFTISGVRLGRGKGFYDKYFEAFEKDTHIFLMGVAYTCQIYAELPYYKHDVKMNGIASEDQLLYTQEA